MPYKFEFNPTKKEIKEGYHRATVYFGHGEITHREITTKYINFLGACGFSLLEEQEEVIERRAEATGRSPNAEVTAVPRPSVAPRSMPFPAWGSYRGAYGVIPSEIPADAVRGVEESRGINNQRAPSGSQRQVDVYRAILDSLTAPEF